MYENISIDSHLPMHDMGAGLRAVAYDETHTNIGAGNDTLIGGFHCNRKTIRQMKKRIMVGA